jgi:hypothetical protein
VSRPTGPLAEATAAVTATRSADDAARLNPTESRPTLALGRSPARPAGMERSSGSRPPARDPGGPTPDPSPRRSAFPNPGPGKGLVPPAGSPLADDLSLIVGRPHSPPGGGRLASGGRV